MTKRTGKYVPRGGGMPGMSGLAQQMQRVREEMAKAHEALAEETLEVTAGGGAVKVIITGQQQVKSITLSPDVVTPDEVEMLQDLLVAAVNQAIERSQEMAARRLEGITGGLNLPGL